MQAVLEILDKSIVDAVTSTIRLASPMINFSPSCPSGVSNAVIYFRQTHSITMMEIKGSSYMVVNSSQPTTVVQDIKKLAERLGGRCQILSGVDANELLCIASNVH